MMSTEDAPPPYEAIMQSVTSYASTFSQTAQAEKLLLQAHTLIPQGETIPDLETDPTSTTAGHMQNPLDFAFLTQDENEKLTLQIAMLVSSEQGKAIMRTVAQKINRDIKGVRDMFFPLLRRLREVDDSSKSSVKFHDRFQAVQTKFNTAIDNSRTLAQNIAAYAEDFEDLILPLYNDSSITLARKKELIQEYVNQAEDHSSKSATQKQEFESLLDEFNDLVADFHNFARTEQTGLEDTIQTAQGELRDLQDRLAKALENSKLSLGIGLGVAVGVVVLGLVFPPAFPVMLVAGAAIADIAIVVSIGFAAYANSLRKDIKRKQDEIKALQEKLADLKKTREDLTKLADEDFQLLRKSLDSIIMVWDSARRDAYEIMAALGKGQKMADLNTGLRIQLEKSVSTYKSVAVYLRGYANGSTGE